MECVHDQNCSIHIGEGAVSLADDIPLRQEDRNCIILCEENAADLILPILGDRCPNLRKQPLYYLNAREQDKQVSSLIPLWKAWETDGIDRRTLVINIGGGVLCDMGGFAASVFKRGIPFVNIPTTLLSMADASVGGKNGVNLHETKNILGTFRRPEAVLVDPVFLQTLPRQELLSGMAEIIKMQFIANAEASIESIEEAFRSKERLSELLHFAIARKAPTLTECSPPISTGNFLSARIAFIRCSTSFTMASGEAFSVTGSRVAIPCLKTSVSVSIS